MRHTLTIISALSDGEQFCSCLPFNGLLNTKRPSMPCALRWLWFQCHVLDRGSPSSYSPDWPDGVPLLLSTAGSAGTISHSHLDISVLPSVAYCTLYIYKCNLQKGNATFMHLRLCPVSINLTVLKVYKNSVSALENFRKGLIDWFFI